jgi:hypothetical protein
MSSEHQIVYTAQLAIVQLSSAGDCYRRFSADKSLKMLGNGVVVDCYTNRYF